MTQTIIRRELKPVILIPSSIFSARMLRVTTAMDRPKERAILSMRFIFLKKTRVQAKPGRKKTSVNPRSALMMGTCSKKGRVKANNCRIESNKSISYLYGITLLTYYSI